MPRKAGASLPPTRPAQLDPSSLARSCSNAGLKSRQRRHSLAHDVSRGHQVPIHEESQSDDTEMSHAYVSNRLHIVFSTAARRKILPTEIQPKLWAYIAGTARKLDIVVREVGGFDDHAHVFVDLPPTMTTSAAVQKIKANSSRWLRQAGIPGFEWQRGYAALSVSASATEEVKAYVRSQPEHHAKHTFEDEFKSLLARYGLKFDPDDLL